VAGRTEIAQICAYILNKVTPRTPTDN